MAYNPSETGNYYILGDSQAEAVHLILLAASVTHGGESERSSGRPTGSPAAPAPR